MKAHHALDQDPCTYEIGGSMNRGLKTASVQGLRTSAGGSWITEQNALYGYGAQVDDLTSASYGDGLPNASQTWSYDAAGNRNDAATDNLNRATSIGGVTCTNDILGNRLTKGSASYGWDALNRMTSYTAGGVTTSYVYRADGMRVSKTDSTGSAVYRYDGQMAMQDVETPTSGTATVTNYALGARGVDAVSKTDSSGTSVGYPMDDGHGNRAATLTKSGTSFSLTDVRTYDAWGKVRVGAQAGRPRARYCANLGHAQDDESGLVYMRARYYEPGSGRFVSEDPGRAGLNWLAYANNNPACYSDSNGRVAIFAAILVGALVSGLMTCLTTGNWSWGNFGRGFAEGLAATTACFFGPAVGAIAGAAVGAIDAWLTGGDVVGEAMVGAMAGGVGGALGLTFKAVARNMGRQMLLEFLIADTDASGVAGSALVGEIQGVGNGALNLFGGS